jgi:hypothetical protein
MQSALQSLSSRRWQYAKHHGRPPVKRDDEVMRRPAVGASAYPLFVPSPPAALQCCCFCQHQLGSKCRGSKLVPASGFHGCTQKASMRGDDSEFQPTARTCFASRITVEPFEKQTNLYSSTACVRQKHIAIADFPAAPRHSSCDARSRDGQEQQRSACRACRASPKFSRLGSCGLGCQAQRFKFVRNLRVGLCVTPTTADRQPCLTLPPRRFARPSELAECLGRCKPNP